MPARCNRPVRVNECNGDVSPVYYLDCEILIIVSRIGSAHLSISLFEAFRESLG